MCAEVPLRDASLDITDVKLQKLIVLAKQIAPGFQLRYKTDSSLMRALGVLAKPFNPQFMTTYTTTLGMTAYVPSKKDLQANPRKYFGILAHELVHMREQRLTGRVWYSLKYVSPQILALLSLGAIGAIWSPWFLLSLCWLVCLAPIPSPGRANIELNGYTMSMAVDFWYEGSIGADEFDWISAQFTGAPYYFMWPFKADLVAELKARALQIRTHKVLTDSLFRAVFDIVKTPKT